MTLTSPLKSVRWLIDHLKRPDVRVLDCRFDLTAPQAGRADHQVGHVPGAVYADLNTNLSGPVRPDGAGGRHPLPDPEVLAAWLGGSGIGNDSVVICYDDPSTRQGFTATRAWWLLRWLGHRQVFVLDGGWPAYLAAGGPSSKEDTRPAPVTFRPAVQPDLVATVRDIMGRPPGTMLVDARTPERYRGETEPLDRKAGHIPGAVNRPFRTVLNPDGTYRPGAEQAEHLALGDAPSITYCGSGVSATPNLLARELAGVPLGPNNRLYAGSWSDWISDDTRPVAVGETA